MIKQLILLFILTAKFNYGYSQYDLNWPWTHDNCLHMVGYPSFSFITNPCFTDPYALVFEDNFDGNTLDLSKWTPMTGVVRDGAFVNAKQWYSPNNIEVSNGTLKLIAKRENLVNQCYTINNANQCSDFEFSSGEIDSKYEFKYGKYEIRCKIPRGKGFWPAFWTFAFWGGTAQDEIDVFEFYNKDNGASREHCMDVHRLGYHCVDSYKGYDFTADFHVFTMEWEPMKIKWFLDGQLVREYAQYCTVGTMRPFDCGDAMPNGTILRAEAYPQTAMSILANLAVQSGVVGPDQNTVFPNNYEIDYIRYYKKIPCASKTFTNVSELNLNDRLYNFVSGTNITFNGNIQVPYNLTVEARDYIDILPGFEVPNGVPFSASINKNLCQGVLREASSTDGPVNFELADAIVPDDKISVFPNPSEGKFLVESQQNSDNDILEVYDSRGAIVKTCSFLGGRCAIDISGNSPGFYALKFKVKDKYRIEKVVLK